MSQQVKVYRKLEFGTSTQRASTSQASYIFADFRFTTTAASGYNHGLFISMQHKSTSTECNGIRVTMASQGAATALNTLYGIWSTVSHDIASDMFGQSSMSAGCFQQGASANITTTGTTSCIKLATNYLATNTFSGYECIIHIEENAAKPITGCFLKWASADTSAVFVAATNAVIDHALKCVINGVNYWIGLYDATTG